MKTLGEYEAQDDFRCPGCNLLIKVNDIGGIQAFKNRISELQRNMRSMFPKK